MTNCMETKQERTNRLARIRYSLRKEHNHTLDRLDYQRNKEKILHQQRIRDSINHLRVGYQEGQYAAKDSKRVWSLTYEEYLQIIHEPCHYCGKNLLEESGYHLDRIDNAKGYTLDNVLPCCWECNRLRGNQLTVLEMEVVAKTLLQFRNKKKN